MAATDPLVVRKRPLHSSLRPAPQPSSDRSPHPSPAHWETVSRWGAAALTDLFHVAHCSRETQPVRGDLQILKTCGAQNGSRRMGLISGWYERSFGPAVATTSTGLHATLNSRANTICSTRTFLQSMPGKPGGHMVHCFIRVTL